MISSGTPSTSCSAVRDAVFGPAVFEQVRERGRAVDRRAGVHVGRA